MKPSKNARHGLKGLTAALGVLGLTLAATTQALAGGGGVSPTPPPKLRDVTCIERCAGVHKGAEGSTVSASGKHLDSVQKVLFKGRSGRIAVKPTATSRHSVEAKVPDGARSGKPKVADTFDNASRSPHELKIVDPSQIPANGFFRLRKAAATPGKAYFAGKQKPGVRYTFAASGRTDVRINVTRMKSGEVVETWVQKNVAPNAANTARWDGKLKHKPAPNGRYEFQIGAAGGDRAKATSGSAFSYHRYKFPIRGRHQYWDGVGAPRAGHTHQGQDVGANCGTRLVAVRGGRVQYKAYQAGGAGNYLVIDAKGTRHDYVYMHMARPAKVSRGQHLRTGQKVGVVGDTGAASGCHLHFEEWSGPGWYEGGSPMKAVTRHLKSWDGWS